MNEHDYHALPSLSHGKIEDLIRDPTLFYGRYVSKTIPLWEGSEETELGASLHKLILEGPEAFARDVAIWRGGMVEGKKKGEEPHHSMRRGTKAHEAFVAENAGKTIISEPDHDAVERFATALYEDPDSRALLFDAAGPTEHTLTWSIPVAPGIEIPCKARLDKLITATDLLVDLKTTQCATLDEHRRQAVKLGYHRKAEWYRRGYFASTGRHPRAFLFVSIRTTFEPVVWVWHFDAEAEAVAEVEIDLAIADYTTRMLSGDWTQIEQHDVRSLGVKPYEIPQYVREELERRGSAA